MEEAAIPRQRVRYFCHSCNEEYQDVLQLLRCPYCSSGFVESLEDVPETSTLDDVSYRDALNSAGQNRLIFERFEESLYDLARTAGGAEEETQEETEEPTQAEIEAGTRPTLTIGGASVPLPRPPRAQRGDHRAVMEQLVWMFGGAARGTNVPVTTPYVLVGGPEDYVFGGDAVVAHLLGQMDYGGPPPLPGDQIEAIPSIQLTQEQIDDIISCSICWDNYILGETVSRLLCSHIFHLQCITPWLRLHATCPICRRALDIAPQPPPATASNTSTRPTPSTTTAGRNQRDNLPFSRVVVRRMIGHPRRRNNVQPRIITRSDFPNARPLQGWGSLSSFFSDERGLRPSTFDDNSDRNRDGEYMDIDYD